jgi:hypothetical protein
MKTLDLDSLSLKCGSHSAPEEGFCVMEAVAYVNGEPHSDHPQCCCPVIGTFLRTWNDQLSDEDRQLLKPLIPRLGGTRATPEIELQRSGLALDWLIREYLPAWLKVANLEEYAAALATLPAISPPEHLENALPVLKAARGAARAAARGAAWAAARAAARAAAWDAARAAAWDAARAAAWDAARAAAGAALTPTVKQLQQSALLLIERMIEVRP